jgi:predicted TIM-barrel fold metal-dependent hydrolase
MQKIIDFHTHIFPDKIAEAATENICKFYGFPREMAKLGTLDDLKENAKAAGVGYFVVNSTATKIEQVKAINDWIASITTENIFGLGTLHPDYPYIEEETERIISLGLKGIKLHPDFQEFNIDDEKLDRIYSAAQGRLPILIHAGDDRFGYSSPFRIANVLKKFPRLDIVAAHLGGWSEWEEAKEHLWGKRIWFDTSSSLWFMPPEKAVEIIRGHGADKIFFGTDYPIFNQKDELERLDKLGLTQSEMEDILFNNANNFLNLNI